MLPTHLRTKLLHSLIAGRLTRKPSFRVDPELVLIRCRYAPTEVCEAIYGGVEGATYDAAGGVWVVPCNAEIDMAIQIKYEDGIPKLYTFSRRLQQHRLSHGSSRRLPSEFRRQQHVHWVILATKCVSWSWTIVSSRLSFIALIFTTFLQ